MVAGLKFLPVAVTPAARAGRRPGRSRSSSPAMCGCGAMRRSMKRRWAGCCGRWADDRFAVGDAGMVGERCDRYASRLRWLGAAGAGGAEARPALWTPVRVPRQARSAIGDPVARRPRGCACWPSDWNAAASHARRSWIAHALLRIIAIQRPVVNGELSGDWRRKLLTELFMVLYVAGGPGEIRTHDLCLRRAAPDVCVSLLEFAAELALPLSTAPAGRLL